MSAACGLILAAPASGSGKTVATLGLLRAFKRREIVVAGMKAGPDYIDSAFHAAAGGRSCVNLDPWAMRGETIASLIADSGRNTDLLICEGVMGLFDGGAGGAGSTADLAAATGWPVVLVADVRRQGASAAAVIQGFARHRADVRVAGVIFNRIATANHAAVITAAMRGACPDVPVLGFLPQDQDLGLPERHLGLVQARELAALENFLDAAAGAVEACVDLDAVRALAAPSRIVPKRNAPAIPLPPLGQRIAVARDDAFAFCYEATLAGWRAAGAEVAFFAPLAGEAPDPSCDAIYLPGGYPELHAGALSAAPAVVALRAAAARGTAIYGECGGYMVLGQGLTDAEGVRHPMAGLLGLEASFAARRLHLGYREASTLGETALGNAPARFRGHEFHYATVTEETGEPLLRCRDAAGTDIGPAGLKSGSVFGSFVHLVDRA